MAKKKKKKQSGWMRDRKKFVIGKKVKSDEKVPFYKSRLTGVWS